ncbi:Hypothetical protein, putative [Bodo saltans]|uniref:Uncharacterized protein n=1 Tax=Bodo saltans TaxID=75058 RepID=A0A0S4JUN6_BODSA|nr:Hypothetical protein, putative [Bodo saltans]|eukprot:CUG93947.1 Hypothetical protein, putative [Bodo saltans]
MASDDFWRERLVGFYAVYNPSCVNSVDAILSTYKGREEDLLKVLVAKYGPEPMSTQAPPSSVPRGVSSASNANKRSETPLELLAKHDDEKSSEPSAGPARADRSAATTQRSTEDLISTLVMKYGVETNAKKIAVAVAHTNHPTKSPIDVAETHHKQGWRQRFYNFFSYYRPDKLSEFDQKLARHEGREVEWLQSLLSKYGPEPPPRKFLLPPFFALEQKTRELLKHRGEKMELEELLNKSSQESKTNLAQATALNEKLLESERLRFDAESARDSAVHQMSQLASRMEELNNVRIEHANISRTLAAREHQCRSQRNEIDQVTQELILRERQLTELSVTLRELHDVNKQLIEDNSALSLALVDPGSEARFHKVVEDIQEASLRNFNHRRKILELEMQQYYEYAKHQIEQRDITIRSLGEQLSATFVAATGQQLVPSQSSQSQQHGGSHEHRALAEEVARLKLQIAVQAEEHKASLASSFRRTSFDRSPPPLQHGEAEMFQNEIDHLRSRLRQTEDEASVAKEALQAELRRQVEEMKDIHDRVDAYEREKSHLISTINELNSSKPAPPLDNNIAESKHHAGAYDSNFTRSNVWSLLYER